MSISVKLAQALGLHNDLSHWRCMTLVMIVKKLKY